MQPLSTRGRTPSRASARLPEEGLTRRHAARHTSSHCCHAHLRFPAGGHLCRHCVTRGLQARVLIECHRVQLCLVPSPQSLVDHASQSLVYRASDGPRAVRGGCFHFSESRAKRAPPCICLCTWQVECQILRCEKPAFAAHAHTSCWDAPDKRAGNAVYKLAARGMHRARSQVQGAGGAHAAVHVVLVEHVVAPLWTPCALPGPLC